MKIVITGHTRGLGKSLAEEFTNHGHEVVGFSRSDGNDISLENVRAEILNELKDSDVFINNAYDPIGQTLLLEKSIDLWNTYDKFIINIGSKCTTSFFKEIKNLYVKNFITQYTDEKIKQETLIKSRLRYSFPKILNVVPGIIDTEMSEMITGNRLHPNDISKLVYQMFLLKDNLLVQELTIDAPGSNWDNIQFLI